MILKAVKACALQKPDGWFPSLIALLIAYRTEVIGWLLLFFGGNENGLTLNGFRFLLGGSEKPAST